MKTDWLIDNASQIASTLDQILNRSTLVQKQMNFFNNTNTAMQNDLTSYVTLINKFRYLEEKANLTLRDQVMQNLIQAIEIQPNCDKQIFGSESWATCNKNAKQVRIYDSTKKLYDNTYRLISPDQAEIIKDIGVTNSAIRKVKEELTKRSDMPNYNMIIKNTQILQNITDTLNTIHFYSKGTSADTNNYASFAQFSDPQRNSIINMARTSLQQLKDNFEKSSENINNNIKKIEGRFSQFQTYLGSIPLDFNEAVAGFPFFMSVGFLIYAYLLDHAMSLRSKLGYNENRQQTLLASLFFDPHTSKKKQIMQLAIFLIPLIIFIPSFLMVLDILVFFDNPQTSKDDLFPAANDFNKSTFVLLSIIGVALFSFGYTKILISAGNTENRDPNETSKLQEYII
jgi:hypothetical protein